MREHTEALAPPRARWVPFILGRPFGVPGDAAFQRGVLIVALNLLARDAGPVLEDYPQEAPPDELKGAPEGMVCPVSFPTPRTEGTLAEKLADEVSQLQAWHELAMHHRAGTTLGVTGMTPAEIVEYLSVWLNGGTPSWTCIGVTRGDTLKQACDELKAFYYEAKAMQPGHHTPQSITHWFWLESAGGQTLLQIRNIATTSKEPSVKILATASLIPRAVELLLQGAATA